MSDVALSGKYKIVVTDSRTNEVKQELDWFSNLITDQGLDVLGYAHTIHFMNYCYLGTDGTAPVNTDVGVLAPATSAKASNGIYANVVNADSPYQSSVTLSYAFTPGQVATGEIREVAVGWGTNNVSAFSRAILTDINGVPTPVTISEYDYVTVYYKLFLYPVLTDVVSTVEIAGTTHTVTTRARNCGTSEGDISNLTYCPFGSRGGSHLIVATNDPISTITTAPGNSPGDGYVNSNALYSGNYAAMYVPGSHEVIRQYVIPTNYWNSIIGHVSTIMVFCGTVFAGYQMGISPPIPKDINKSLALNFKISWSRYSG